MDDDHNSSAIRLLPAMPLRSPRPPGLLGALPGYRAWLHGELERRSKLHIEPSINTHGASAERAREPTRVGEALMAGLLPQLHPSVPRQPSHMAFVAPAKLASRPSPPTHRRVLPHESPRRFAKSPRMIEAAAACIPSPRVSPKFALEKAPMTVETFLLPRKMKAKRRMALLGSRGLDQQSAEQLCNSVELERIDGSSSNFLALAPNGTSLSSLVNCVNWMAIAADSQGAAGRRNPRGLAFVQWADPATRVAPSFADNPEPWFFDDSGGHVSAQMALDRVRAAVGADRTARVHQLVLLGGRGAGAALLRAIAAASGVNADDLLYVSAAHAPTATKHLWERVYVNRFGFTRVPSLRANLDDPHDPEEAHEVPLVVVIGDLRALFVDRT